MDELLVCKECGRSVFRKNGTRTRAVDGVVYQKVVCKNCGTHDEYPKTPGSHLVKSVTNQPVKSVTLGKSTMKLSEADLRAKHDNHFKVTKAAQALEKGTYIENRDFIASLGLSGSSHTRWTGNTAFDKYRGKAGGITYWSHPESIQKMRDDGVLI